MESLLQGCGHIRQEFVQTENGTDAPADFVDSPELFGAPALSLRPELNFMFQVYLCLFKF